QEALRLFTRGNSWFLRMENKIGCIEPGKLADLAVLNKDYFTVPDTEITQIRSGLTLVDGKVVHEMVGGQPGEILKLDESCSSNPKSEIANWTGINAMCN